MSWIAGVAVGCWKCFIPGCGGCWDGWDGRGGGCTGTEYSYCREIGNGVKRDVSCMVVPRACLAKGPGCAPCGLEAEVAEEASQCHLRKCCVFLPPLLPEGPPLLRKVESDLSLLKPSVISSSWFS